MIQKSFKILVVDDEEDIVEFLQYNLKKEGFIVNTANNGVAALKTAIEFKPDLILLDIMMPEMDGIEACEKIRENPSISDTLVVFLTARAEDFSQIAGFSSGADDYITKPIKPKILISRIKALLKRYDLKFSSHTHRTQEKSMFGNLYINIERHLIELEGAKIEIPKKEFMLLVLLSSKPSVLFTREEIFSHLWGTDIYVNDRTIDVYIRKLRSKIGKDRIRTVKGVGYTFEP